MLRTLILVAIAGGVLGPEDAAWAQRAPVGFYRTGIPSGHGNTVVGGITADGSRVIGFSSNSVGARDSFVWTPGSPLTLVPEPSPDFLLDGYLGLSADGQRAVGSRYDRSHGGRSAVTWNPAGGPPTTLGFFPSRPNTYARAVSGDGNVVVGNAERWVDIITSFGEPVRWTQETGFVSMGRVFPSATNGLAVATNFDGSVVVGSGIDGFAGTGRAFRWTPSGGYTVYPQLLRLDAITPDGTWMAGGTQQGDPVRMTASGVIQNLDPGHVNFSSAYPLAMSADASLIIGSGATWSGPQTLFIWSESEGMSRFDSYLFARGVSIPTDLNIDTNAVWCSADGLVITGYALNGQRLVESWVVVLPSPGSFAAAICFSTLIVRRRR